MKALKIIALTAVVAAPLANADETSNRPVANPLPMEEIIVTASYPRHARKPIVEHEAQRLQVPELDIKVEVSLPALPPEINL